MNELLEKLGAQVRAAIAVKRMNYKSFKETPKTVSKLANAKGGDLKTLLSIADQLDMDIVLMER